MKTPFVWLGSGRAKKWEVAAKGRWLDDAARVRLPVPPGAILLDELFQLLLNEGVVVVKDGRISAPSPQWLHEAIYKSVRFPRLENPVVVRSASAEISNAWLNVNFHNPEQLSQSLCALWSQIEDQRRDILVMEMVGVEIAGTAVHHPQNEQDLIQIADNPPLILARLNRWQRPSAGQPPHLQRLQQLLRGVRRTFGQREWRIDWLDDGRICWLIQIY